MFDVSLAKLFLLALIALLVLGPEKMVEMARTAGKLLRKLRQSWDSVRENVERELEIEELRKAAHEAAAKAEATQSETSEVLDKMRKELDEVRREAKAGRDDSDQKQVDTHQDERDHDA